MGRSNHSLGRQTFLGLAGTLAMLICAATLTAAQAGTSGKPQYKNLVVNGAQILRTNQRPASGPQPVLWQNRASIQGHIPKP